MFNWLRDDIKGVMNLPRCRKAILVGFVLFAALVNSAFATSDVRVVGPISVKGSAAFPISVVGGTVSALNSSTDTVPAGDSFVGASEDCSQAGTIIITVYTNVGDTTTNELTVSFSPDGVLWPNGDGYRVGQSVPRTFSIVPRAKYFKVAFSNGSASPATEFYLQTVLKTAGIKDSIQFGTSDLPTDQQSQPVVARLVAENEDNGAFVGLRTTADDNLTVAVKEIDSAITLPVSGPLTDAELRATPAGVQIYGSTGTGTGVAIPLDLVTNAPIVIDYEHHEVHAGSAYSFSTRADVNGSGTTYNVMMVTSDTAKWPHMRIAFSTEAEFDIELYEGTTYTGGASTTTFNRDRNSSKTADMRVILGATATGNGTRLRQSRSGSGTGSGGGGSPQEEWILKQNTVYNFRFTKQSTGTHYIYYRLWWYEHTNKN